MPTAFIYIRVSTPAQQVEEQVGCNKTYAEQNGISIIGHFGDFGKRHHAHKRHNFQAMLDAIPIKKPDFILVQRLDRFGTADPNQLGYFLTILEQTSAKVITTFDGMELLSTRILSLSGARPLRPADAWLPPPYRPIESIDVSNFSL